MKKFYTLVAVFALVLPLISFAQGWNPPPANPPNNNAPAPINVSFSNQAKEGGLAVGKTGSGILRAIYKMVVGGTTNTVPSVGTQPAPKGQSLILDVEGAIGAKYYCDETGNNCVPGNPSGGDGYWKLTGNILLPKTVANNVGTGGNFFINQGNSFVLDNNDGGDTRIRRYYANGVGIMELKTDSKVVMNLKSDGNVSVTGKVNAQDFCLPDGRCLSQMTPGGTNPPPPPGKYNLSVSANGPGSVSPASGQYTAGSSISVRAIPGTGATFDRWVYENGTTVRTNPTVVSMNKDQSITAYFTGATPPQHTCRDVVVETELSGTGGTGGILTAVASCNPNAGEVLQDGDGSCSKDMVSSVKTDNWTWTTTCKNRGPLGGNGILGQCGGEWAKFWDPAGYENCMNQIATARARCCN